MSICRKNILQKESLVDLDKQGMPIFSRGVSHLALRHCTYNNVYLSAFRWKVSNRWEACLKNPKWASDTKLYLSVPFRIFDNFYYGFSMVLEA